MARASGKAGGQQAGGDIAAHEARRAGDAVQRRVQQREAGTLTEEGLRAEGGGGQRADGYTGEQALHDGVAGGHGALQLGGLSPGLGECPGEQGLQLLAEQGGQAGEPVLVVDGILDACDDIRAVGGQSRPVGAGGQGVAGGQVVQPQRRGGGAQVDGGGAACLAGGDGGGIQRLGEDAPAGGGREDDLVAVLRHHTAGQTRHAVDADAAFAAAAVAAAGGGQGTAGAAQQSQQGIGIIAGEAKNISAAGHADT